MLNHKLKCVLVDDDDIMHKMVHDLCAESSIATLTKHYHDPKKFLQEQAKLEYDICLLDINMTGLDGIFVAQLLNGKPVIFVTAMGGRLNDAIDFGAIDVLLKPLKRERFNSALDKAEAIIRRSSAISIKPITEDNSVRHNKFGLFNVKDAEEKVRINLADIFLISTDIENPRNKRIVMRNGDKHTLMYCNFDYLEENAPWLIRVNKSDMISSDAVLRYKYDMVILKINADNGTPKYVTLNRSYRKEFIRKIT